MTIYPLFSIPVLHDNINCDVDINYIKNLNYKRFEDNTGFGSISEKILLENEIQNLRQKIEEKLNFYYYVVLGFGQGKLKHVISWVNKHKSGDYSPKHLHPNSFFSGVFYLKCNSNSGKFWMHQSDAHISISSSSISPKVKNNNIYNSKSWWIQPKQNDIILFPSHLSHSVDINESDEDRYAIAFNYFVEGFLGLPTGNINLTVN